MSWNQRGQEAKFLTGIPVLLLILACVGIFLGFSFSLAAVKGIHGVSAERLTSDADGMLYQPTRVGEENVLVIDAVLRADAGTLEHGDVEEALQTLLAGAPDDSCLLLALDRAPEPGGRAGGAARNDFYIVKERGVARGTNFGAYPVLFALYRRAGELKATSVVVGNETRMYLEYYRGRCLS